MLTTEPKALHSRTKIASTAASPRHISSRGLPSIPRRARPGARGDRPRGENAHGENSKPRFRVRVPLHEPSSLTPGTRAPNPGAPHTVTVAISPCTSQGDLFLLHARVARYGADPNSWWKCSWGERGGGADQSTPPPQASNSTIPMFGSERILSEERSHLACCPGESLLAPPIARTSVASPFLTESLLLEDECPRVGSGIIDETFAHPQEPRTNRTQRGSDKAPRTHTRHHCLRRPHHARGSNASPAKMNHSNP